MNEYQEFLKGKKARPIYRGFDVDEKDINPTMHLYQRDVTRWALKLGKSALFENVGLGKTIQSMEWARHVALYTQKPVLILAPLGVSYQTVQEGKTFGYEITRVSDSSEVDENSQSIYISNYERLHKFDTSVFGGVVLDESSILKSFTGKTKRALFEAFANTPYKLACSATPAPNDYKELGNHADFLDVMASNEMLSRWFNNDTMRAGGYTLKNHGREDFWRWITSWAVCISKPKDLGDKYHMEGYELPPLNIVGHYIDANQESIDKAWANGRLFPDTAPSSTELGRVKRVALPERLEKCKEIVASIPDHEPIIIWCSLNDESKALAEAFPDAVEIKGSTKNKEELLIGFGNGDYRILITKGSIAGHGMNWQHCNQPIFFGLDFSFENFYQQKGRNHRYGQTRPVDAHIIYAETEGNVVQTLYRKQEQFEEMQMEMSDAMRRYGLFRDDNHLGLKEAVRDNHVGELFSIYQGDSAEVIKEIDDNSVDLIVESPPFANLYIYSDNEADMGNSSDEREFFAHYHYLIKEQFRILRPGRIIAVHCKDLPSYMNRDGVAGLKDFPGEIIRAYTEFDKPRIDDYEKTKDYLDAVADWESQPPKLAYHSRVTIWKDPVIEMTRTKNHGLLHKNFEKESNACRQGMADYMLMFRKYPLDGQEPVTQERIPGSGDYIGENAPEVAEYTTFHHSGDKIAKDKIEKYGTLDNAMAQRNYSISTWQRYASPVWFDIDQTRVLNANLSRLKSAGGDEKHICPLQLDVIERTIDLHTNKGDVVFSSFMGIGSEVVSAIKMGRYGVGIELKQSYFKQAVKFCIEAEKKAKSPTLFDLLDEMGAD